MKRKAICCSHLIAPDRYSTRGSNTLPLSSLHFSKLKTATKHAMEIKSWIAMDKYTGKVDMYEFLRDFLLDVFRGKYYEWIRRTCPMPIFYQTQGAYRRPKPNAILLGWTGPRTMSRRFPSASSQRSGENLKDSGYKFSSWRIPLIILLAICKVETFCRLPNVRYYNGSCRDAETVNDYLSLCYVRYSWEVYLLLILMYERQLVQYLMVRQDSILICFKSGFV